VGEGSLLFESEGSSTIREEEDLAPSAVAVTGDELAGRSQRCGVAISWEN